MRYLDAVALAKLKDLRFELFRRRAEGMQGGRHRSVQHAFSLEFAQHRPYAPGDELKFLDWKVYARKDRFFVRQSQEEQALRAYLLVDSSASMGFRHGGAESKFERACALAMSLAYLTLAQGDAAGLLSFDSGPGVFLPPRRRFAQLDIIDAALSGLQPKGGTDLDSALRQMSGRISRRSLIALFSDLSGEPEPILKTLKALRARKHELLVVQLIDPTERDLDLEGSVRFEGLEDGSTLRCDVAALRQEYRDGFERRRRMYESGFHQSQIPFAAAFTDEPRDQSLSRFLSAL